MFKWFVSRTKYDALFLESEKTRSENFFLRSAIKEANQEIFKYRELMKKLTTGDVQTTQAFEAAMRKK
jgi:hypothetical protein